jgi:hypothetical protein
MMGQLNHDQSEFFYSFRLDEAIPDDHPARATCVGETASRATREYLAILDMPHSVRRGVGAIAQNLRRLAKLVARPPPAVAPCPA